MDIATLVQQQHQTLDGNNQGQKEQNHVSGTVASADGHAVDRFHGKAGCSAKEIAVVVAPDNDNVGDFSTQCSDVIDDDNEEEETDVEESGAGGWIMNPPVSTIVQRQPTFATTNGDGVLPNADQPTFGNVRVQKSKNVRLVNQTCYNGPVIFKQYVYTNPTPNQDASRAFDNTPDLSTNKDNRGDPNGCIFPQNTKLNKVTQWLWTWRCAALTCILAIILQAVVIITTVYFSHHPDSPAFPEIPDSSLESVNITSVRFVERNEWGAQPPSEPLPKLKLSVPYVIISHTATDFCTTQSQCTFHVRFAQTFHIESRKWSDIAYNFLVGGDGLAYVGRSWDYVGAHSFGFNSKSIGISFIGTFNSVVPPKTQIHAARKIIELGVEAGKIAPDYKLLGHRQVSKTLSPGDALYNEIKNWPHWSPQP